MTESWMSCQILEPHPVGYEADHRHEKREYDGNEHYRQGQTLAASPALAFELALLFLLSLFFRLVAVCVFCQSCIPPGLRP